MYCSAGECRKAALPDGTPCPGGICESATEECVQCLGTDDCAAGMLCCEGSCRQCCVPDDCSTANPCAAPTCADGACGETCLLDGTECGGGLTCQGCVCQ
jgi:hypothetical protein